MAQIQKKDLEKIAKPVIEATQERVNFTPTDKWGGWV
jgi:hypothetical protein